MIGLQSLTFLHSEQLIQSLKCDNLDHHWETKMPILKSLYFEAHEVHKVYSLSCRNPLFIVSFIAWARKSNMSTNTLLCSLNFECQSTYSKTIVLTY